MYFDGSDHSIAKGGRPGSVNARASKYRCAELKPVPLQALLKELGKDVQIRAGAGTPRPRDGAPRRPRSGEGPPAERGARLRSEGGRGPREVRRRRGRDRARL